MHRPRPYPAEAKPPLEVRLTELRVEPWPDGRRLRVHLDMTLFQENPSLEVFLTDEHEKEIARADIIETADNRIVFTLHIRNHQVSGTLRLTANITYPEAGIVDTKTITFRIDPVSSGDA